MALIMKYIDSMQRYMDSYGDPRTKDWPMMSSPFPTLAVCLCYVYIVKVLGPRLMENRKPFQLQNTLIVYNFLQVVFSTWLFYEISISGWLTGHYNFRCQPVDYSNHPRTLRMVHACWWYYFSKFTEFMDTIFFVLRKKTSQVSTLHVIHHGCMPMSVWFGVKFTPGGHSTFFGLLNTFVHIVMYSYYLFAAMGTQYHKYLWWKKYLTTLQMIQFVAIMVHAFQLLFIDCNYPRAFVWWIGMHAVMFFFLFNEFYRQTYKDAKERRRRAEANRIMQATEKMLGICTNGTLSSRSEYSNGSAKHDDGEEQHLVGNGTAKTASKAADYYVRGEVPADITQRKIIEK
ncbi:elongation of very long chain fatty acids protein AAEL008004 isoform X1 [Lutzomyia longipalpis]|uniref:Elongation of very long chain fatty acids protein n=1 Tax=Lutzomyia longipalpis TaxID=7200 RepID=A0A7G3ABK7_LUTLO|nr:elongation of very long chain fatty acids protein AAEL008004 isoform X1 [Lutzomyia longipalpis]XP_055678559.1 elongation of very long chain fatty acids protein AAEL008004 isoform X1 [Lutzomyia longipalpis]XP_055678560.1 elongation of very long chain fatty acids protein AAEL008004 isoform X1 [Lutzomyia longipalpis]XP_055678561.1 elongation of very long chain fatty acids protein AAEL008004 isoform X1 [Lutzomyia longipalpis]XP_055678562.1 elongation of very long chain fatty acids protein AAEL00